MPFGYILNLRARAAQRINDQVTHEVWFMTVSELETSKGHLSHDMQGTCEAHRLLVGPTS